MRAGSRLRVTCDELRRRIERLDRPPVRPATVRSILGSLTELDDSAAEPLARGGDQGRCLTVSMIDPGWVIRSLSGDGAAVGPLRLVAESDWWPSAASTGVGGELLGHLWRYSLAMAAAARRIAAEAGDSNPEVVGQAAFLSRLGLWAVAAVDLDWLVKWWRTASAAERRRRELDELGTELNDLARRLAGRWGCPELVVEASWLYDPRMRTLNRTSRESARIGYIQQASEWADQTPWSIDGGPDPERLPSDPRIRIVIAEVQARAVGAFVASDATGHEERVSRQLARVQERLAEVGRRQTRTDRLLIELSKTDPSATLDDWGKDASLAWCAEPEVTAARVVWKPESSAAGKDCTAESPEPSENEPAHDRAARPPSWVLPVRSGGRDRGELQIWTAAGEERTPPRVELSLEWRVWQVWAALVAARDDADRKLRDVARAHRDQVETEEKRLQDRMLDALAEFAGGAGHELNNPLAVIAGRAQLLMARTSDVHATKSLKVIEAQVKRAHQILRDLMFIARPPRPLERLCRPTEVLRLCLRDFQESCASRGVRLVSDLDDSVPATWADVDGLRHIGEVLLRNALQATPQGASIQVRSSSTAASFTWTFSDTGHGISGEAAARLFDPFFCGRQAGRGLGLGLPRAARIVAQGNGRLQWTSHPGSPTVFSLHMPIRPAPAVDTAPSTVPPVLAQNAQPR